MDVEGLEPSTLLTGDNPNLSTRTYSIEVALVGLEPTFHYGTGFTDQRPFPPSISARDADKRA
jgi:hypothetical protein